jgi:stage II sporulation protein D
MKEPIINVGICDGYPEITGRLNGFFSPNGIRLTGKFIVRPKDGKAAFCDEHGREILHGEEIRLFAERDATFTLNAVRVGLNFHWEQRQELTFQGDLRFLAAENGGITAINELPVETYLESVVSSEMNGDAPLEFLKAHAIASRSWLFAMLASRERKAKENSGETRGFQNNEEVSRWYDREDHELFDVCADDHCQRYQGITDRMKGGTLEAVRSTRGAFLMYNGQICDARYHKACGGLTENYATCWEQKDVPYLSHVSDSASPYPPVLNEKEAEKWILSSPDVYCNLKDLDLLRRILPAGDSRTTDFFRWRVEYGNRELAEILLEKSGIDFGVLQNLVPLERGPSGRISRLRIEGTNAKIVVGKELEIRRWLSRSHLYSSAFIVQPVNFSVGVPAGFILHGAGWGHGVGLCQIGAAAMAARGLASEEILSHYFKGATLIKRY